MVVPLAPLNFSLTIRHVELHPLDVLAIVDSGSIEYAFEGPYEIPSTPTFDPSHFVKKEVFDRLKDKIEAYMEQTTKNQKFIQNTLGLILARLTNSNL